MLPAKLLLICVAFKTPHLMKLFASIFWKYSWHLFSGISFGNVDQGSRQQIVVLSWIRLLDVLGAQSFNGFLMQHLRNFWRTNPLDRTYSLVHPFTTGYSAIGHTQNPRRERTSVYQCLQYVNISTCPLMTCPIFLEIPISLKFTQFLNSISTVMNL